MRAHPKGSHVPASIAVTETRFCIDTRRAIVAALDAPKNKDGHERDFACCSAFLVANAELMRSGKRTEETNLLRRLKGVADRAMPAWAAAQWARLLGLLPRPRRLSCLTLSLKFLTFQRAAPLRLARLFVAAWKRLVEARKAKKAQNLADEAYRASNPVAGRSRALAPPPLLPATIEGECGAVIDGKLRSGTAKACDYVHFSFFNGKKMETKYVAVDELVVVAAAGDVDDCEDDAGGYDDPEDRAFYGREALERGAAEELLCRPTQAEMADAVKAQAAYKRAPTPGARLKAAGLPVPEFIAYRTRHTTDRALYLPSERGPTLRQGCCGKIGTSDNKADMKICGGKEIPY